MQPDYDKYRFHVDQFDLSEAEKRDLIHTVWAIMQRFADQAFGIEPLIAGREDEAMQIRKSGSSSLNCKEIELTGNELRTVFSLAHDAEPEQTKRKDKSSSSFASAAARSKQQPTKGPKTKKSRKPKTP